MGLYLLKGDVSWCARAYACQQLRALQALQGAQRACKGVER